MSSLPKCVSGDYSSCRKSGSRISAPWRSINFCFRYWPDRPHFSQDRRSKSPPVMRCSSQRSALLINWDDRHSPQFATQEQIQGKWDDDQHEKQEHIGQFETTPCDVLFSDFQNPIALPKNKQQQPDDYKENPAILGRVIN